ncbi:TMAO reductase system periplasmic protein TorT [Virgifigura deserti]|uniref:TMAO reductase system periplasmic protein TorT n=1 Tax=Virgifigura deserti TaxID=2268457 RepID=UPI003CCBBB08
MTFVRKPLPRFSVLLALISGLLLGGPGLLPQAEAETWQLQSWVPPFDYQSEPQTIAYTPLKTASRKWRLCASYPHLKDSYWLSVNYGMVEEARRLGVALRVVEAGGYPNLDRQIAQIEECVAAGADALIVGPVSYSGLTNLVAQVAQHIPVIAAVNDIDNRGITAKSAVPWTDMGGSIGAYFARIHPKGSPPVKVAWFPGPKGAGWVRFVETGFRAAIAGSSAEVVATKWGDTGTEIQLILIEEMLEEHPDIDYIVGSAVTAGAAVSLLRARGLTGKIQVLADYFTHAVYRGIKRDKILAAPTDAPVLQGRLAIDQAVRALEGKLEILHAGPRIRIIDQGNIETMDLEASVAPAWFTPTFTVE